MKLIVDVEKDYYEIIKYNVEHGQKYKPWEIIANGIPYEERPQGEWIAVKDKFPDTDGCYLVSLENGQIVVAHSSGIIENHDFEPRMLAWQPLPEPYKAGGKEE